ncbi:MAG: helix-turn-helix domain-containing protein [Verrucomicrobia bacterium]|nr:helix-turn-helix domain-containing protein [Verrucomicrobiota bacterium]
MKITAEIRRRAAAYRKSVRWSEEDDAFIGSIEGLCGDCHHGSDPVEVFRTLKRLAEETVAEWDAAGLTLPESSAAGKSPTDPAATRKAMGLSQTEFARLLAVSVRTLHKWEQYTSRPSGAAKTLLKVAAANPQAVRQALRSV